MFAFLGRFSFSNRLEDKAPMNFVDIQIVIAMTLLEMSLQPEVSVPTPSARMALPLVGPV